MSDTADGDQEIAKWDPSFTKQLRNVVAPVVNRWFRADVRGLDNIPEAGGALVVSNHSGGMMTPDVLIFASAFYESFGYHRPVYTLAHTASSSARWTGGCAAPASSRPAGRTLPRRCTRARWCWCSPAVTTTPTGPR